MPDNNTSDTVLNGALSGQDAPQGTGIIARSMAAKILESSAQKADEQEGDDDQETDDNLASDDSDTDDEEVSDGETEEEGEEEEIEDSEEDESDVDAEEDSDDQEEDGAKRKKPIEINIGDGKIRKLPPDAKITIPIDGGKEILLADALDEITGRYNVDREMTRVRKQEATTRELQSSNEKALDAIKDINNVLSSRFTELLDDKGDPFLALAEMAELAGHENPTDFIGKFVARTYQTYDHLIKNVLGHEGNEVDFLNRVEVAFRRRKDQRTNELKISSEKRERLNSSRSAAIQRSGLSDNEWASAERIIARAQAEGVLEDYGIEKDSQNRYQIGFQNTEQIAYEASAKRIVDKVLAEAGKKLPRNQHRELIEQAVLDLRHYRIKKKGSDEDVQGVIRDAVAEIFSGDTNTEDRADAKKLAGKVGKVRPSGGEQARPKKKEGDIIPTFRNLREKLRGLATT